MPYGLTPQEASARAQVDAATGLSAIEAASRLAEYGPNRFAESPPEPTWQRFLRQYRELMQIVLVVSGIISIVVVGSVSTGVLLLALTVFNALMSLSQEGKAAAAVSALQEMMILTTRVRRDSELLELPAADLVPGDIVLIEAGDLIPADGRLLSSATLEVDESPLTGESLPVAKDATVVSELDTPLGDRLGMVFMNTSVTRGSATLVVTATGMQTEVGHISELLESADDLETPLTRQLNQLTQRFIAIAGLALIASTIIGLLRGEEFQALFVAAVAFAVAAIPTGLPTIVTSILSRRHADPGRRWCHREAAAVGGDAWLDLGHQLGQDRHADAESDDRGRDGHPGTALRDQRDRLRHHRQGPPRGRFKGRRGPGVPVATDDPGV